MNDLQHDPAAERRMRIVLYTLGLSGFAMLALVVLLVVFAR